VTYLGTQNRMRAHVAGAPAFCYNDPRVVANPEGATTAKSILIRGDFEEYLVRLYFGPDDGLLAACVDRAWDLTAGALAAFAAGNGPMPEVSAARMADLISESRPGPRSPRDMATFDTWHRAACVELVAIGRSIGLPYTVGIAQAWLNQTLKFVYTVGERRLRGYTEAYPFCHAPLGQPFIGRMESYGFPALPTAWSDLDDYEEYLKRQAWLRHRFSLPPLDIEFLAWLGEELPAPIEQTGCS
jgi:hypothetical protein